MLPPSVPEAINRLWQQQVLEGGPLLVLFFLMPRIFT